MSALLPDATILFFSLFNAILFLWLALTVFLLTERRTAGSWLVGAALFLGAAFFFCQAGIAALESQQVSPIYLVWWPLAWGAAIILPLAWYAAMLWFAGFWDEKGAALRARHRIVFWVALLCGAGAVLLLFASPLLYSMLFVVRPAKAIAVNLALLLYPLYALACIVLALDVLRHPSPSPRIMGDLARRRARPWLVAASVVLLFVSLLVGGLTLWFVSEMPRVFLVINWTDLLLTVLIALAVLFLGQAIVSYEIFTGRALPRRGLRRHWHNAIILALGASGLLAAVSAYRLSVVYAFLLVTVMLGVFYALFSWRSYIEREQHFAQLRPFVTSQHVYDALLDTGETHISDTQICSPFRALTEDLLNTSRAFLIPTGPLSPLIGPPLCYPERAGAEPPSVAALLPLCDSPKTLYLPLDPQAYAGALLAVPLWSERGLIGLLLLGEKNDRGLYTQEEIEIARTAAERLVDTQAAAEIASRLMALQRTRLAESRVVDARTRRALHDDILPILHSSLLALNRFAPSEAAEALQNLGDVHRRLSDLLREIPHTPPDLEKAGPIATLRQMLTAEFADSFDKITWQIDEKTEAAFRSLSPIAAEVLLYAAREAVRNAARHGRGADAARPLHLTITTACTGGDLTLAVHDDGLGLPDSPARQSAGHGLALHSTMMAVIGGTLTAESQPGRFTRVTLTLPKTAAAGQPPDS